MKFTSEASIKILEYAAHRETETRDFYRVCLEKATLPGTREILRGLVNDEERHYQIVTELLSEAKKGGLTKKIQMPETPDTKARLETAFSHKVMEDREFSAEKASIQEMLGKALDNEKESFNHYSGAARDAEEGEAQEVYKFLANEENRHYVMIDNLINYLDDPGKWLYEEENLIFRL